MDESGMRRCDRLPVVTVIGRCVDGCRGSPGEGLDTRSSCDAGVHGGGLPEKGLRSPDRGKAMPSGCATCGCVLGMKRAVREVSGKGHPKASGSGGWGRPDPAEKQQRRNEGS